ncbi:peptide-methionine (S)-S-oxide reductase MsrA [Parvibaculum sp.]|jgi:peptide-methionine (S)-S-oxide reductase|uniref:peptide-methionine (S)-S-oxide reductase MsrA n=1 Tax=Parvibaculum sp. TaxID=2024848 RepID=UPI000C53532B|nr:peptide-methionine (S)-S-oxide reductase MsrA [Parvibaculum sp.]MAM93036.1 peptide-methionine (S)-S-oxide reductase [Parvibaculum sp.]HCX67548.1 peptide-methionine (S)-S-oxide reductase [Rhodobiaceae bacterium]|tara:strand:- start:16998 stop:17612 length:615 start_codon:yes stop_codon:yes gene_type:complete
MRCLIPFVLAFSALVGTASAGMAAPDDRATAIFAGGCFWCMEPPFDKTNGVIATVSGYIGGTLDHPTYEQVSAGGTGHAEAVKIVYDPSKVSYSELLHIFWRNVDPLRKDAQFCDTGHQYRSAIFYLDDEQKKLAKESKEELEKSGRFSQPVVTEIAKAGPFYPAEKYHQDYYVKNPNRYTFYRWSCGRDARLEQIWGSEAGGH